MTTFGEVSWNDESFGGEKKNTNTKDLWLRLKEGSNEVRLVTQPFQYLVHKFKKDGDPGYGQKVKCSAINGSCPLCDLKDEKGVQTNKAKPRWLLGVISRDEKAYKILDISYQVFSDIKKLAQKTKNWGDPTKYDIDIFVDKNGGASGYYSVQPLGKEALSATDQDILLKADLDELKRQVTPPDAAYVQRRMDKINGVTAGSAPAAKTAGKPAAKPATPVVSMTDDEDLDSTFPSHDNT